MIDIKEAKLLAENFLQKKYDGHFAIDSIKTRLYPDLVVFVFNTEEFILSRDEDKKVLFGPIIVDRETSDIIQCYSSGSPVKDFIVKKTKSQLHDIDKFNVYTEEEYNLKINAIYDLPCLIQYLKLLDLFYIKGDNNVVDYYYDVIGHYCDDDLYVLLNNLPCEFKNVGNEHLGIFDAINEKKRFCTFLVTPTPVDERIKWDNLLF